jgi:uncharacterized protein
MTTPLSHRRGGTLLATAAVVALLAAVDVARDMLPAGTVWFSVLAAAALVVLARHSGLTWTQLGLSRERLRPGLAWGLGAVAAVGAVYAVGLLLPATRALFLDSRYHLGTPQALLTAFVVIPLGTVLLEELAFRSVLWGVLRRHMRPWRVLLVSSLLFGMWHVVPALGATGRGGLTAVLPDVGIPTAVLIVLGTVAFTAVGGVVAGELRRRSGSVLASAGMHWATNALGVLFALGAWQLAG